MKLVQGGRSVWWMMAWIAGAYGAVCAAAFVFQRSLLFFPTHEEPAGRLAAWKDDGRVIGFCREVAEPRAVWLMMHGNAGQASDREYVLECVPRSDSVYVLEYPGYGGRPGSPSQASFDAAAAHAYDALRRRHPETPVCVIGESIGSGPACALAARAQPPDRVVLIVPFDSLQRVASRRFRLLPMGLLLRDRWDNVEALRGYAGPVEILGARDDAVIPCEHARALAESHPGARYHEMECGHNDWTAGPGVSALFGPPG